jgi:hypothetical protein
MISLLIPTRRRPIRLRSTIESALMTAMKEPEVLCYVSDDDDSYDGFKWDGAKIVRGPRIVFSDLWNALVPEATGDILMLCADDVIFRTPGWDVEIERAFAAVPDRILMAFADDGGPSGKTFSSLPFVSRRWIEIIGYFTPSGYSADYCDTHVHDVAQMIGRKKYVDILIEHCHHAWGKAEKDETYRENEARWMKDRPDLMYAKRLPERQRDAEKLRAVIFSNSKAQ